MGSHQHGNKGVEVTPFKTKGANLGRETCRYVQGHRQPRVTDVLVLPRTRAVPLAILPGGIFLSTEDMLMAISIFDIAKKKKAKRNTYHMITATRRMMASLSESKNSLRACPCSFMFPITNPKHMEKTTSPKALTPFTDPGTGTNSSLILVSVSMASDTLFITAPTSVSLGWMGTLKLFFS